MSFDTTPGLTVFNGLDAMVASYERTRQHIVDGFAALRAARSEFNSHFALGVGRSELNIHGSRYHHSSIDPTPEHQLAELRRQAWEVIIERLELRKVMSIAAWAELQKGLATGEGLPEITHDNVAAFGRQNINPTALERMMTAAIAEVFEWLRPCRTRYKRNSQLEIPERIVLERVVSRVWHGKGWHVEYSQYSDPQQHLIALENVCHYLDGRGQVARAHKSDLQQAIEAATWGDGHGETELFEFRVYKNCSLHLRWKRLDLLREFNRRAGGLRVKPGAARGGDMVRA